MIGSIHDAKDRYYEIENILVRHLFRLGYLADGDHIRGEKGKFRFIVDGGDLIVEFEEEVQDVDASALYRRSAEVKLWMVKVVGLGHVADPTILDKFEAFVKMAIGNPIDREPVYVLAW
jgi:hypothetical protein